MRRRRARHGRAPGASSEPVDTLVWCDSAGARLAARFARAKVVRVGDPVPVAEHDTICVAVTDVEALRRVVTGVPNLGTARRVVVLLAQEAPSALSTARLGNGPPVQECRATRSSLDATYAAPVPGRRVLIEVARRAGDTLMTPGWPVVDAAEGHRAEDWPCADPAALIGNPEGQPPPDVVLTRLRPVEWAQVATLETASPLDLGPIDDQVHRPVGFRRRPTLPIELLERDLRLPGPEVAGLELAWGEGPDPLAYAAAVARAAMRGIPLVSQTPAPAWARALLGGALVDAVAAPCHLEDTLAREEIGVVQRRVALAGFGPRGHRRGLASAAGLRPRLPRVSVIMASRRPGMIAHAAQQISRQRGVELEWVLALHGVEATVPGTGVPTTVVPVDSSEPLGAVLNVAAAHATGDVLVKMDDDDWYGPDFLADLLLARDYAGADVTGAPPEWWYLQDSDTTVRHDWPTETWVDFVAGGTMLLDRGVFADIGGFRPLPTSEDGSLLRAVRSAGGTVYRTHGLGYLLRRTTGEHAWSVTDRALLDDPLTCLRTPGFFSNRVLAAKGPGDNHG